MSEGKDFAFIFLLDRSASMNGVRIRTAKQALKLFLKSLPVGSKFAIISFGAAFRPNRPLFNTLKIGGQELIESTDENTSLAITQVEYM